MKFRIHCSVFGFSLKKNKKQTVVKNTTHPFVPDKQTQKKPGKNCQAF